MTSFTPNRRGTTLVEIMIAAALVLLLFAAVGTIFRTALHYHRRTSAQMDLEQATITTLKTIVRECSESNWISVSTETNALIFATPRGQNGEFLAGPDGQLNWGGLNCYSLEDFNGVPSLVRRQDFVLTPGPDIPDPSAPVPPKNLLWFQGQGLPVKLLQPQIELFEATRNSDTGDFGQDVLDLKIRAAAPFQSQELDFSIELETRIKPRN